MKPILSLLCFFALVIGAQAQNPLPVLIQKDTILTKSGGPYVLTANTLVEKGVKLSLMPGTRIVAGQSGIRLMVDGEIQSLGKKDTMVEISGFEINLSDKALPYRSSTGKGALFQHTSFFGSGGAAGKSLYVNRIAVRVEDCQFRNTYYGIYGTSMSDTSELQVVSSSFKGLAGRGYPIYVSGTNGAADIRSCEFDSIYAVYLYGKVRFEGNVVNHANWIYFNLYNDGDIKCNWFGNIQAGVQLMAYSYYDTIRLNFENNTLDSTSTMNTAAMLRFSRYTSTGSNPILAAFHGNNFLTMNGKVEKIQIYGSNANPSTTDTIDFKGNYWQSTDSATIASFIKDYNDDITIKGRVDFGAYLQNADTFCAPKAFASQQTSSTGNSFDRIGSDWQVYPNPVQSTLQLRSVSGMRAMDVAIYGVDGRLQIVPIKTQAGGIDLNMTHLPSGVYVLLIEDAEGIKHVRRILKQ